MATSILSKLNVIALPKREKQSAVEHRRSKLVQKLEEQMALAQAQAEGKPYSVSKQVWQRDDAGNKSRVTRDKIVRPWWFANGSGVTLTVRYGSRPLALKGDKCALQVGSVVGVPEVLKMVVEAVRNGELDAAMEASVVAGKSKKARG